MTLTTNHLLQAGLSIVQIGNLILGVIPERYRWIAAGVIAALQWFVSNRAHFSNTDGTPQGVAFKPSVEN